MIVIEEATIIRNIQIASGIWETTMVAPKIRAQYKGPGQFVNLLADIGWDNPLRRPMSIALVKKEEISIIYKVFGSVTSQLTEKQEKDTLNLMGPLGNVFSGWNNDNVDPVLVGGGVGLAPILNLHDLMKNQGFEAEMVIGARSAEEHFLDHNPEEGITLTTDDGSLGNKGTVIPSLEAVLDQNQDSIVFACGPEPMLSAVQKIVKERNIPAQLSVESYMGCGVGLCQGCVIERSNGQFKEHSYHEQYSLVCMDGPVYKADEVTFA